MGTTSCRCFVFCAAMIGLILVASAASADLVVNGGFESPNTGLPDELVPPGTLDGWSVTGAVEIIASSYWTPNSGLQSLDMNGGVAGTISQSLATDAGQTYNLTFAMSGNFDGTANGQSLTERSLEVFWGGDPLGTFTFTKPGGWSKSNMGWTTKSASGLTATGNLMELSFVSLELGDAGPTLDDVHVNAVPEPGSLALLGLGLPLAGVWYRRRKRSA